MMSITHTNSTILKEYKFYTEHNTSEELFQRFDIYPNYIEGYTNISAPANQYRLNILDLYIDLELEEIQEIREGCSKVKFVLSQKKLNLFDLLQKEHISERHKTLALKKIKYIRLLDYNKKRIPKRVYAASVDYYHNCIGISGLVAFRNGEICTLQLPNMQIPLKVTEAKQYDRSEFGATLIALSPEMELYLILSSLYNEQRKK
ncbi:MAG: hypothetical protein GY810_27095 [Aureispira sp.]|nr:hypothetical protein [Aureispira sp.]